MSNEEFEPGLEDFAGLVKCLQETPDTLSSIIEEIRALSEPPALAGGQPPGPTRPTTGPPANAGGPPPRPTRPTTGPPANAGGSDYSALRWRNSDGEFSVLENICHLRDIEAEGYAIRITRILEETNPFLADIDGARLAIERNYNDQDPDLALRAFVLARINNLEKLKGVDAKQLVREGTLEGAGSLTLKRLAEMMQEHDRAHIQDLRNLRQKLVRLVRPTPVRLAEEPIETSSFEPEDSD